MRKGKLEARRCLLTDCGAPIRSLHSVYTIMNDMPFVYRCALCLMAKRMVVRLKHSTRLQARASHFVNISYSILLSISNPTFAVRWRLLKSSCVFFVTDIVANVQSCQYIWRHLATVSLAMSEKVERDSTRLPANRVSRTRTK